MRSFLLPVLISCYLAAATMVAAEPTKTVIPGDWYPALSPSINAALQQLSNANSQAEMNLLSRQIADMTDAQVFIAYVRLYERLSSKEQQKLRDEQTRWLKQRAKAATDGVESEGGSLAPLEANNAELTVSEKRLVELRARYKALSKNDSDD